MLEESIENLSLPNKVINELKENNINLIKDLWVLNRKNLKSLNFTDSEINKIIISLQLQGLDLNKKIYK